LRSRCPTRVRFFDFLRHAVRIRAEKPAFSPPRARESLDPDWWLELPEFSCFGRFSAPTWRRFRQGAALGHAMAVSRRGAARGALPALGVNRNRERLAFSHHEVPLTRWQKRLREFFYTQIVPDVKREPRTICFKRGFDSRLVQGQYVFALPRPSCATCQHDLADSQSGRVSYSDHLTGENRAVLWTRHACNSPRVPVGSDQIEPHLLPKLRALNGPDPPAREDCVLRNSVLIF